MDGSAPTGTGQPPAGPGQRPKKSRVWLVVLVAAVAGACVLAAFSVAGYFGYQALQHANLKKQVTAADEHAAAIPQRLLGVHDSIASADIGKPADARRTLSDAGGQVDAIASDLAVAREEARAIPAEAVATPYVASLDEADAGVRSAQTAIAFATDLATIEERTHEGLQKANAGTDLITSAIGAGNKDDYNAQESQARQASTLLAEAEQLFNEAARIDRTSNLGQAAAWASASRTEADTIREQAVAARSGDIARYNASVDKVNALTEQVNAMPHPPALSDEHWADARLKAQLDTLAQHAHRAAASLDEAHGALQGQ